MWPSTTQKKKKEEKKGPLPLETMGRLETWAVAKNGTGKAGRSTRRTTFDHGALADELGTYLAPTGPRRTPWRLRPRTFPQA